MPLTELTLPLQPSLPWSLYGVVNWSIAIVCTVGLGYVLVARRGAVLRLAFIVAVLSHVIYQWPLAVFAPIFERNLQHHWLFSMAIHVPVISCVLWLGITCKDCRVPRLNPYIELRIVVILVSLLGLLSVVYLWRLGVTCSGLYALVVDPELSLLAREASIKLLGSSPATYAYGALANVVGPLVMLFGVLLATQAWRAKRYWVVVGAVGVVVGAIVIVLLPGIKGSIIPGALAVTAGLWVLSRTWRQRLASIGVFAGITMMLLVGFEVVKDRPSGRVGKGYDFGACAVRIGACDAARDLVESLGSRVLALGIPTRRVGEVQADVYRVCSSERKDVGGSVVPSGTGVTAAVVAGGDPRRAIDEGVLHAAGTYLRSIVYRATVIPIQAASWHFKYVETFGSPGARALPGARMVLGEGVNMPRLVHDVFYVAYSSGSSVSTGTVPTSSLVGYPAVLGVWGILLVIVAILGFDTAVWFVLRSVSGVLVGGVFGLTVVAGANIMVSDFGTVLLSHGAAVGMGLLFIVGCLQGRVGQGDSNVGGLCESGGRVRGSSAGRGGR